MDSEKNNNNITMQLHADIITELNAVIQAILHNYHLIAKRPPQIFTDLSDIAAATTQSTLSTIQQKLIEKITADYNTASTPPYKTAHFLRFFYQHPKTLAEFINNKKTAHATRLAALLLNYIQQKQSILTTSNDQQDKSALFTMPENIITNISQIDLPPFYYDILPIDVLLDNIERNPTLKTTAKYFTQHPSGAFDEQDIARMYLGQNVFDKFNFKKTIACVPTLTHTYQFSAQQIQQLLDTITTQDSSLLDPANHLFLIAKLRALEQYTKASTNSYIDFSYGGAFAEFNQDAQKNIYK